MTILEAIENHQLIRRLLVLWTVVAVTCVLVLIWWVLHQVFQDPSQLPIIITAPVADAIDSVTALLAGMATLLSGLVAVYKILRYKQGQTDDQ